MLSPTRIFFKIGPTTIITFIPDKSRTPRSVLPFVTTPTLFLYSRYTEFRSIRSGTMTDLSKVPHRFWFHMILSRALRILVFSYLGLQFVVPAPCGPSDPTASPLGPRGSLSSFFTRYPLIVLKCAAWPLSVHFFVVFFLDTEPTSVDLSPPTLRRKLRSRGGIYHTTRRPRSPSSFSRRHLSQRGSNVNFTFR